MTKKRVPAVGIDLGTTHSVVAYLDTTGRPSTIPNAEGENTTASVVFFDEEGPIIGKQAARMASLEPERVAQFAKRDMGNAAYEKSILGNHFPPEVMQALILKKLKEDAELVLGDVQDVVITVPAYFNEPRRKATQDAGRLAGLNVLDIINEPTAAAVAFGVQQGFLSQTGRTNDNELLLVYDLGGGTFDVTLMEMQGEHFNTVATAGDVYLGGIDWDERLLDFIAERFVQEFSVDPRNDERASERLRQEAEMAKHALTVRTNYMILFEFDGNRMRQEITREKYESLTRDLLERTLFTVRKLLKEASLGWADLTRIILVGGSSRMPMIREALEAESQTEIDRSISPDEAVAHGAAVYAGLLVSDPNRRPNLEIKNVNSHDLGVLGIEPATGLPRRQVLIGRNTSLPATGKGRFVTKEQGQGRVVVNVIEGGDASGKNATRIGKCIVTDLPPDLPAQTPVDVRFHYEENGRLNVEAWLPKANRQATLNIKRAAGLSDETLQDWQQRIAKGFVVTKRTEPPGERTKTDIAKAAPDSSGPADKEIDDLEEVIIDDGDGSSDGGRQQAGGPDSDLNQFLQGLP